MTRIIRREDAPRLETVKGRHGEILMAGEKCMMMINTIEPGIPTPPTDIHTSKSAFSSREGASSMSTEREGRSKHKQPS